MSATSHPYRCPRNHQLRSRDQRCSHCERMGPGQVVVGIARLGNTDRHFLINRSKTGNAYHRIYAEIGWVRSVFEQTLRRRSVYMFYYYGGEVLDNDVADGFLKNRTITRASYGPRHQKIRANQPKRK